MSPILLQGVPGGPELLVILFVLAVLLVVGALVPLAVSYLIYRDATDRGSRHALAWGVGAFFGSLVVWVLYYVVRDEIGTRA
jgi:threonine/homoserine/homoserine lactone efflux protein